jgi:hypothetical protein
MRWQLILQLTLGLGLLFGFGWYTSSTYVDAPARELVQRTSLAEASGVASNIAVEWEHARSSHRNMVLAAAQSPVIGSLGQVVSNAEARTGALKAALEGTIALVGGRGDSALINERGQSIASSGEAGPELHHTFAVKDALAGATSVRVETVARGTKLIAATALRNDAGAISGVLVLASTIDDQRAATWNALGPIGTGVALATKDALVAATIRDRKSGKPPLSAFETNKLVLDDAEYTVVMRELSDDAGVGLRVFGLARSDDLGAWLTKRVRFLVMVLGVLSILLAVVAVVLSPVKVERMEPARVTPSSPLTDESIPTVVGNSPVFGQPVPMASQAIESFDTPLAARPISGTTTKPPMKTPEQAPVSPFSATLADTAFRAGIETLPLSSASSERSEAFDEIANAVFSSPPQQPRPHEQRRSDHMAALMNEMPDGHLEQDLHEDLPMPVEHMQLPGLREPVPPRGMGSPSFVRGNKSAQPTPPPQQRPFTAQPVPQPQAQTRGPMFGGSPNAVPLPPSSQPAQPQRSISSMQEDPWKSPGIANAKTQPMGQLPASEPRRFTTTGDIPVAPQLNGARESMSSPPLASSRPYTAPQPGGTPLPMTGTPLPSTVRDVPMPFDEEHYRVVYNEFVGSKARLGEAVDNITFEGFSSKLRNSEKELIDRHGCRAVRFQVLVKDRQVSLRPQLVR